MRIRGRSGGSTGMHVRGFLMAASGFLVAAIGAVLLWVSPATAATEALLTFDASVDGRALDEVDANEPLELRSGEVEIALSVTNDGDEPLTIRYVGLEGGALGFDFFSYVTRVDLTLEPGETGERRYLLDVGDLGDQATGLLPGRLTLLSIDRDVLAEEEIVVDVRGSLSSVYGTFGLAIIAVTALLMAFALLRLFTNRLPVNRWRRATYFAVPGLGVGLTLTFGLSVLRVLSPGAAVWVTLLIAGGVVGFWLGYLTPTPYDETAERDELDELVDLERREAIADSVLAARAGNRNDTLNHPVPPGPSAQ